MNVRFVEATQDATKGFNWGKFMVATFDGNEWGHASALHGVPLLAACGWRLNHVLVFDLQTGEGALLSIGGSARADLEKHRVWVCPMFEPFLAWLYTHIKTSVNSATYGWLDELPSAVELPDAEPSMQGYRRTPEEHALDAVARLADAGWGIADDGTPYRLGEDEAEALTCDLCGCAIDESFTFPVPGDPAHHADDPGGDYCEGCYLDLRDFPRDREGKPLAWPDPAQPAWYIDAWNGVYDSRARALAESRDWVAVEGERKLAYGSPMLVGRD